MLQRGHSDFAWFKERTDTLQSDTVTAYAEMASSNSAPALNPEPADPEERAEHNLPPKSYADSVSHSTGQYGVANGPATLSAEPADPQERAEHDLPPKSYADSVVQAPATTQNGDGLRLPNGDGPHQGVNGDGKKKDEDKLVHEKYTSHDGKTSLTSVKVDEDHHQSLKHSKKTAPRGSNTKGKRQETPKELASGRKAGAGWERSAYEPLMIFSPLVIGLFANRPMLVFDGHRSMSLSNGGCRP